MSLPPELLRTVSRDEINELPIQRFEGEVRLVAGPQDLEPAMADLAGETVIGFDTETRPAFRVGESYLPCLAQAATARAAYLFQLARADFSAPLAELLSSESIVKAGVGIGDDLRQMKKLFPFEQKATVDLGELARAHGLKHSGVRYLAALFLGIRIPKGSKTSNWATRRLSPQQITYAATDAWVCRELYLKFEALGML
ncbi:MAG TPA: 3'-5' exonuclease [Burkholderiales bacterium]|jgi:ribonuclease D|nr:3'-5' exonuclease [Burkholderiales bacterium]